MFYNGIVYISKRGGLKVMLDHSGLCFPLPQQICAELSIKKNDRLLIEFDEGFHNIISFNKVDANKSTTIEETEK